MAVERKFGNDTSTALAAVHVLAKQESAIQTVGRENFGEGGRTGLIFLNGDLHSDDACGIMVIGVVAMGSQKNGLCRMMPGKRH